MKLTHFHYINYMLLLRMVVHRYWNDKLNNAVFCVQLAVVPSRSDICNSVVEALSEIAPAEHYLRTNVPVPSGHVIGDLFFMRNVSTEQSADVSSQYSAMYINGRIICYGMMDCCVMYWK